MSDEKPRVIRPYTMPDHFGVIEPATDAGRPPRRENYTVGGIPGVLGTNLPTPPRDPDEPVMQYIVLDVSSHDPVDWVGGWQDIDPEEHYNWGPGKWARFRIKPTEER